MELSLVKILIEMFGGLGLFLYGMRIMSDGLENAAGDRLKSFIEVLTKNKIMAVIVGAIVTVLVQSSSASTVMVVGFVNAGIMNLTQAVGIIMGANIGTTVTAQLVSINLTAMAPIAIGIGVAIKLFSKSSKTKMSADILIGFGILFLGMDLMKNAMKPLREFEAFTHLLASFGSGTFTDTALAILTGFAVTAVLQSSSATTGLLVALASTGLLDIHSAFPVLLGTNIGTTVTAMISSVGASKTAKRAALMHLLFNLVGTVVFILFFAGPTMSFVTRTSVLAERQLANAHTLFNVATTLMLLPFAGILVKIVEKLIPVEEEEIKEMYDVKYLDDRILETPSIAMGVVLKEVLHMGNGAMESLTKSLQSILNNDEKTAKEVFKLEKAINHLERVISQYLIKLSNTQVSDKERSMIDGLFSTINDIERVGDHADNLAEIGMFKSENRLHFSETATAELEEMYQMVHDAIIEAFNALSTGDKRTAEHVLEREGQVDKMEKILRKDHIRRLNEGKCEPSAGIIFLDIISNLERVADHASNIALAVLDRE